MPDLGYFVAVVAVAGAITVGLRAVPFLLLSTGDTPRQPLSRRG